MRTWDFYSECINKWKLEELTKVIDDFENTLADYVNENSFKTAKDYSNILLFSASKSVLTFREIITLCLNGYSDGALSLTRNLYEQFIILMYFEINENSNDFKSIVEKYFLDYDICRLKALKYEAEYCSGNEKKKEQIENQLKQIRQTVNNKCSQDYWWAGKDGFKDMVDTVMNSLEKIQTGAIETISKRHLLYKRACVSIHAGSMGNSVRLGIDNSLPIIDTSENLNGQSIPLYFATTTFRYICCKVCSKFKIAYIEYNNALITLENYYYNKSSLNNNTKEAKECPNNQQQ